jgi:hypothetical protein
VDLSAEAWMALGSLAVAVIAIPVTIWATRTFGNRRRKLLFSYESISLAPATQSEAVGVLKITFRDLPTEDPHLLTIRLQNIGPADVASSHFDASRDVQVKLNCTLYGVVSTTHPRHTISVAAGTRDAVINLSPMLLRRQDSWVIEAVVSGAHKPEIISTLVDTDIVDETVLKRATTLASRMLGESSALAPGLVGAVARTVMSVRRR